MFSQEVRVSVPSLLYQVLDLEDHQCAASVAEWVVGTDQDVEDAVFISELLEHFCIKTCLSICLEKAGCIPTCI